MLEWIRQGYEYVNLAGRTSGDLRKTVIHGESGIIRKAPKDLKPKYIENAKELRWPDGRVSLCFTSDEPEGGRGAQSEKLALDEVAAWPNKLLFDNLEMGCRIGDNPQIIACTTGKRNNKILRSLKTRHDVVVTRGSTYDNQANLSPRFVQQMHSTWEGTEKGKEELYGDCLDELSGVLWTEELLNETRVQFAPKMKRVVIGCDPSISTSDRSDEKGIVVVGLGEDDHIYILEDLSIKAPPKVWVKRLVLAYKRWGCTKIVTETNRGGELVKHAIEEWALHNTDIRDIVVEAINTQEDKGTRAEPISVAWSKHRCHLVGEFPELEEEMTTWDPATTKISPNRIDGLVFGANDVSPRMPKKEPAGAIVRHTKVPLGDKIRFARERAERRRGNGTNGNLASALY